MERNINIKNIERRIKEIAKDYESKGFTVSINPKQSELPQFLKGFEPDIIAKNELESVVIEVKTKGNISELKQFETLANTISKKKNWRFELVFTNPIEQTINSGFRNELSVEKQKERITEIKQLVIQNHYDAAFLLGWATLEAAIRMKLNYEKSEALNKPTLSIIKTIYSLGYINQHDYRNLEKLNNQRNYLIHGFDSSIDRKTIEDLLNILTFLIGDSKENIMYEWLEALDLDHYEDIYSLYSAVREKENIGAFTYDENEIIEIGCSYIDESLELSNDIERKQFLDLIEQEYMDDMDPEGWYGFKRAMEKDD
jgi:DNA-binding Lrp family transcriptional regulator